MQMPSFMIPAGETSIASPDEVERKRLIALALMRQGMDTGPTDMWGGVARLGQSVVGALMNKKADRQEQAGRDDANKNFTAIMERLMGPSSAGMEPAGVNMAGGEEFEPSPYEAQGIPDPRSPEFNVIDDRQLPVDPNMIKAPQQGQPPQQAQPQGNQLDQLPMGEIISLLNNPYLQPGQAQFLQSFVKNKMDTGEWQSAGQGWIFNNRTGEKMQVAGPDPLESEYKRAQIAKMQAETAGMQAPIQGARPATPEEKQQFGVPADAPLYFDKDGSPKMISGGEAMSITTNPDGTVSVTKGSGKPLTEAQSKDTVYATRAGGALPLIDQYGDALTSRVDRVLDMPPMGLGRNFQSKEYQLAEQAGNDFLTSLLRKESGATITEPEMALYGRTFLPQPGDGPDLLQQKKDARGRAIEAIKAGMPPSAIVASEMALQRAGAGNAAPQQGGDPLSEARAAISKGADPEAVKQRLQQMGIDPSGL